MHYVFVLQPLTRVTMFVLGEVRERASRLGSVSLFVDHCGLPTPGRHKYTPAAPLRTRATHIHRFDRRHLHMQLYLDRPRGKCSIFYVKMGTMIEKN